MIIGHQKQKELLEKLALENRLSHAYLFSGEEKLGKKIFAINFISFVFQQKIEKLETHPDFIFIQPEESKEIKISQIRNLITKLSLSPSLAKTKAVIIDDAHLMNQEAQTCFLKTLEEPKGNVLIILVSHRPQYLLPTIISRVQTVKFNPVANKEILDFLNKKNFLSEKKEKITLIGSGKPGLIIDLAENEQLFESFNQRIEDIKKLSMAPFYFRFNYVKNLAEDRVQAVNALDIWLYYYRRILLEKPTKKTRNIINLIEKIKFLILNTNINLKLALERLVLEI